jgi:sialidase-1
LFIEAAVNDQVNGTDSITQVFALEGIVRQAKKSNPGMDIIMMSFADPDKIKAYNNGNIPVAVANHEYIAGYYHLPSINLAKEVRDRIANKEFSWENDFKDLHPSPFGQRLYFKTIKDLLIKGFGQSSGNFRPKLPEPIHKKNFENGIYARIEEAVGDSKWKLVNNWAPDDNVPVRDKFVHVPVWAAASPGAVLTFTFKGNAVGMAVISGPDAGMVNYSIDGGALKQIDLFTPWSSGLHLPWYVLFAKEMTNKKHTLRLMISDQKNSRSKGNACRIVHFLVNQQ